MKAKRDQRLSASAGRKRATSTWAGTYGELTALVRKAFGFLERREKMAYSLDLTPPEASFEYSSPERGVTIAVNSEYAGTPWIVVHSGDHAYRMDLLVRRLAPQYALLEPRIGGRHPSAKEVRALLAYFARFLRNHGRPILDGDPEFFASLRTRKASPKPRRGPTNG